MQGKNYTIGQSFSPALDVTCERPAAACPALSLAVIGVV